MDNREVINDVLVNLFNEILRLEEEAIITDKYKDISNNDMHIIEAVGLGGGNMSSIAAKLKITVGSLTTSMNSLVKKGYVKRERSEKDRRVVFIQLTNKGLCEIRSAADPGGPAAWRLCSSDIAGNGNFCILSQRADRVYRKAQETLF